MSCHCWSSDHSGWLNARSDSSISSCRIITISIYFFHPMLRNPSSESSIGGMTYGGRVKRRSLGYLSNFVASQQMSSVPCLLNGLWTLPSSLYLSRHRHVDKGREERSRPVSSSMNDKTSDLSAMVMSVLFVVW